MTSGDTLIADQAESARSEEAEPKAIDQRTRSLVRLILGARSVSNETAARWIAELMEFSRRPAEERQVALDRAERVLLTLAASLTTDGRLIVRYARAALRVSPECAHAYYLLAEFATKSLEHRYDLYHMALRAAQRSADPQFLKAQVGRYEEHPSTQACLQALMGMASTLWQLGEEDKAVRHYQEALRLSAADTARARYPVLYYGLATDNEEMARQVLLRYEEDLSGEWLYGAALFRFRTEGDSRGARQALRRAITANPRVPDYLLGRRDAPKESWFSAWEPGSEEEAIAYGMDQAFMWQDTPGALAWLARIERNATPQTGPTPHEPPLH